MPRIVPMLPAMKIAIAATMMEILEPWMIRLKISLPRLSVPNRNVDFPPRLIILSELVAHGHWSV